MCRQQRAHRSEIDQSQDNEATNRNASFHPSFNSRNKRSPLKSSLIRDRAAIATRGFAIINTRKDSEFANSKYYKTVEIYRTHVNMYYTILFRCSNSLQGGIIDY